MASDWKYVVRTTHAANAARRGSTAEDGKIKTSFEQDVKVSMSWAEVRHRARILAYVNMPRLYCVLCLYVYRGEGAVCVYLGPTGAWPSSCYTT